jgi:hypothetical protein
MNVDALDDTSEAAVRNYLLYLEDPDKLIDHELIATLKTKAAEAADPIERLMAFAELERAQRADDSKYRLDFILHAKNWAMHNNVSVSAFRQLGVKDDVLRSAGLLGGELGRGRKQRRDAPAPRRSVSVATIQSHVRSLRGRFTLMDLYSTVGGSPMTVRKAVQELIAEGTIKRVGPATDWTGRGRAPVVYEVL